ncbi:MAG TPA: hypothetical protein VJ461_06370, partial [Candidatus Nanoarchaeia archaeon]|nr:hypothetical protein [Candidatus Nanoarchaeia archaeon]
MKLRILILITLVIFGLLGANSVIAAGNCDGSPPAPCCTECGGCNNDAGCCNQCGGYWDEGCRGYEEGQCSTNGCCDTTNQHCVDNHCCLKDEVWSSLLGCHNAAICAISGEKASDSLENRCCNPGELGAGCLDKCADGYCRACGSCPCASGACDTSARKYCVSGAWSAADAASYCSNCAHCGDNACRTANGCNEDWQNCPHDCDSPCDDDDLDGYGGTIYGRVNGCAYDGQDCDDTIPVIHPGAAEICYGGRNEDCEDGIDCNDPDCTGKSYCIGCTEDEDCPQNPDCWTAECISNSCKYTAFPCEDDGICCYPLCTYAQEPVDCPYCEPPGLGLQNTTIRPRFTGVLMATIDTGVTRYDDRYEGSRFGEIDIGIANKLTGVKYPWGINCDAANFARFFAIMDTTCIPADVDITGAIFRFYVSERQGGDSTSIWVDTSDYANEDDRWIIPNPYDNTPDAVQFYSRRNLFDPDRFYDINVPTGSIETGLGNYTRFIIRWGNATRPDWDIANELRNCPNLWKPYSCGGGLDCVCMYDAKGTRCGNIDPCYFASNLDGSGSGGRCANCDMSAGYFPAQNSFTCTEYRHMGLRISGESPLLILETCTQNCSHDGITLYCGQPDGCGGTCPATDNNTGYYNNCDRTDVCRDAFGASYGVRRVVGPIYNGCFLTNNSGCGSELIASTCTDGIDNDCDGFPDCNDGDCPSDNITFCCTGAGLPDATPGDKGIAWGVSLYGAGSDSAGNPECCGNSNEEWYNWRERATNDVNNVWYADSITTSSADGACCGALEGVYSGTCYNNTYLDIVPSPGDDARVFSVNGLWYDCDGSQNGCENSCSYRWLPTGDGNIGEYNTQGHGLMSCCRDDAGENIRFRMRSTDLSTDALYVDWPSDINDMACCNAGTDCVYSTTCYTASTGYVTGAGSADDQRAACNSTGAWSDCDGSSAVCTNQCRLSWVAKGEVGGITVGEYSTQGHGSTSCCGDDAREFLKINIASGISACCNDTTDCVDAGGNCQPSTGESRAMGNCADGIDNDCDGENDWDNATWSVPPRGPAHGDNDCRVGVTPPITVTDVNPYAGLTINITCGVNASGFMVNSVFAYIDNNNNGVYDAGDWDCGWPAGSQWLAGNAQIKFANCNVGSA